MTNVTILGVFYDGYEDLWIDFANLIKKNWPDNPFQIVIANQQFSSNSQPYENIKFINAGFNAEFSKRIRVALEQIETDYVILLLEDFFVEKKIDTFRVKEIINFVEKNKIVYYSMPIPTFVTSKEKNEFYKGSKVYKVSGKKEYVLNCQPAIWKKDFLYLCIGKQNYNAWIFEGLYAKNNFIRTQPILENCVVDYSNPLNLLHGAIQGKIIKKTKKALKKNGYELTSPRQCLSSGKAVKYSLKNFISKILYFLHLNSLKRRMNKNGILSKYMSDIENISSELFVASEFYDYKKRLEQ